MRKGKKDKERKSEMKKRKGQKISRVSLIFGTNNHYYCSLFELPGGLGD